MLEQLINSLDSRGVLAIQVLLGKRCIELLEGEDKIKKILKPQAKIKI